MSNWTTRIKSRMQELDMTQESLANKLGITRGAITHYLAGRRVPPLKQFKKIALILKCDPAWLQFGSAPTKKEVVLSKKEKSALARYPIPLLRWEQVIELGGASKIRNDEVSEFVPHLFSDHSHWYALRVKGDSMVAASGQSQSFREGDVIIIDPEKNAAHGNFVIALLPKSKEAVFKQYVIDGGVRYLKPLNPQYPMIQINDSTHICGIVTICINKLEKI